MTCFTMFTCGNSRLKTYKPFRCFAAFFQWYYVFWWSEHIYQFPQDNVEIYLSMFHHLISLETLKLGVVFWRFCSLGLAFLRLWLCPNQISHPLGRPNWWKWVVLSQKITHSRLLSGKWFCTGVALDGDTVWNLFVFVTLFSFNATVIVTHCKRLEHLHGVRLERSPHYQGFVALACADGGFLDLFEWAKRKMFQTCSGLTLQHIFMYGLSTSFGFPGLERCETGYVLGFCYRNSVRTVRTVVFGGRKLGVFHHRICL